MTRADSNLVDAIATALGVSPRRISTAARRLRATGAIRAEEPTAEDAALLLIAAVSRDRSAKRWQEAASCRPRHGQLSVSSGCISITATVDFARPRSVTLTEITANLGDCQADPPHPIVRNIDTLLGLATVRLVTLLAALLRHPEAFEHLEFACVEESLLVYLEFSNREPPPNDCSVGVWLGEDRAPVAQRIMRLDSAAWQTIAAATVPPHGPRPQAGAMGLTATATIH